MLHNQQNSLSIFFKSTYQKTTFRCDIPISTALRRMHCDFKNPLNLQSLIVAMNERMREQCVTAGQSKQAVVVIFVQHMPSTKELAGQLTLSDKKLVQNLQLKHCLWLYTDNVTNICNQEQNLAFHCELGSDIKLRLRWKKDTQIYIKFSTQTIPSSRCKNAGVC